MSRDKRARLYLASARTAGSLEDGMTGFGRSIALVRRQRSTDMPHKCLFAKTLPNPGQSKKGKKEQRIQGGRSACGTPRPVCTTRSDEPGANTFGASSSLCTGMDSCNCLGPSLRRTTSFLDFARPEWGSLLTTSCDEVPTEQVQPSTISENTPTVMASRN